MAAKTAKGAVQFECVECGYQAAKYFGRCPQCQAWNTLVQSEPAATREPGAASRSPGSLQRLDEIDAQAEPRRLTGLTEFDRVLGGGVVGRSVVLIGGEPGVGKSTLLLEVSAALAQQGRNVLYYSGEESAQQIKLRADRLGVNAGSILLYTSGGLDELLRHAREQKPEFLIVDSIQTLASSRNAALSGSPATLRQATAELIELAKGEGITVFLIGHITKEGQLAGPKTLEHMVDAVLYFQGETQADLRLLRAEKNRFGPLNEVGIFQMSERGLASVNDPSLVLIQNRQSRAPGTAVFPALSGTRPLLSEVQALVSESPFAGNPRRIAIGFDAYRLSMLISIIEKKLRLPFYKSDVFLNVTGGLVLREPAADLAVCLALVSSYKNIAPPPDTAALGEIGLTGELRPVSFLETRAKEAARQGFARLFLPAAQGHLPKNIDISAISIESVRDLPAQLKS